MNKKILFSVGLALTAILVAVFWLLSELIPDTFGGFNLSWAIAIFSGICGLLFILKGLFEKKTPILKKINIFFGAGMIVVCIVALVGALTIPKNLVLPIIAIVVTVALLFGVLAVGGKKWDQADNKKAGYKTYRERKEEVEKNKED